LIKDVQVKHVAVQASQDELDKKRDEEMKEM
jgi:hypothetical protein